MEYSDRGLALTKSFEGFRSLAYQDVVGVWTIGYGHVLKFGESFGPITDAQATVLLLADIAAAVQYVNDVVKVTLTQGQFDALVDFTFNLGVKSLKNSTLLKLVNKGDFTGAAAEFPKWDHAGGKVIAGLARRREAEQKMFLGEAE